MFLLNILKGQLINNFKVKVNRDNNSKAVIKDIVKRDILNKEDLELSQKRNNFDIEGLNKMKLIGRLKKVTDQYSTNMLLNFILNPNKASFLLLQLLKESHHLQQEAMIIGKMYQI